MFEIDYKGGNSIVISTKKSKLVVDPRLSLIGLGDLKTDGSVELLTETRFGVNSDEAILTIDGPGEYGVADFDIRGIPAVRHIDQPSDGMLSTIYRVDIAEVRIGIIGNIDEHLSEDQLERLGVIDILVLPVGGSGYTLDAVSAAKVVKLVDPKIVIPVHYADKMLKYEVQQDDLQLFVSELSVPVEVVGTYKFRQLPITPNSLSIIKVERS